jgi:multidrug resistance efflux pump
MPAPEPPSIICRMMACSEVSPHPSTAPVVAAGSGSSWSCASLIFSYNLIADRLTPYTSQATVQAYVVGIAPEVAGNIVAVQVKDNQQVEQGDVLFRIDPQHFDALARAGGCLTSPQAANA